MPLCWTFVTLLIEVSIILVHVSEVLGVWEGLCFPEKLPKGLLIPLVTIIQCICVAVIHLRHNCI